MKNECMSRIVLAITKTLIKVIFLSEYIWSGKQVRLYAVFKKIGKNYFTEKTFLFEYGM